MCRNIIKLTMVMFQVWATCKYTALQLHSKTDSFHFLLFESLGGTQALERTISACYCESSLSHLILGRPSRTDKTATSLKIILKEMNITCYFKAPINHSLGETLCLLFPKLHSCHQRPVGSSQCQLLT